MKKNQTVTGYVLRALIPYTEANLQLAFHPNQFFNELERITNANRNTLASTLSRAKKTGLVIERQGIPILSLDGRLKINLQAEAPKLKNGLLIVSFDIPEACKRNRDRFRNYLKLLEFQMVQRSVWICDRNYGSDIKRTSRKLEIEPYVKVYLANEIK